MEQEIILISKINIKGRVIKGKAYKAIEFRESIKYTKFILLDETGEYWHGYSKSDFYKSEGFTCGICKHMTQVAELCSMSYQHVGSDGEICINFIDKTEVKK